MVVKLVKLLISSGMSPLTLQLWISKSSKERERLPTDVLGRMPSSGLFDKSISVKDLQFDNEDRKLNSGVEDVK